MAPSSKENEVLTVSPERTAAAPPAANTRPDETATGNRPLPVALEVPVTVNGARTVEGSDKREPFSETTKTVLVFGNGAVIRLGSPVSAGQLLFLTNEKTKKEVVCQVVKSKNYKSVSGYVELEFTESVVGFWGMRFPSDRIGTPAPTAAVSMASPPAKPNPVAPIAVAPKVASPVVPAAPKIAGMQSSPIHPEVRPAQVSTELKPMSAARPVEVKPLPPAAPKATLPAVQNTAASVPPVVKKPEVTVLPGPSVPVPVVPAPPASGSLASTLTSLLGAPEAKSAAPPAKSAPISSNDKPQPASVAVDNSSEELKQQAARLQEQLSAMLFSAPPTAKPTTTAPPPRALDTSAVSGVAGKVFEMAKPEPTPIKAVPPAKIPPPMKSSLDSEELKVPSWLEPLARNAAQAPPVQEPVEREKIKHPGEIAQREEHVVEPIYEADAQASPEVELPGFGSLLPLDEQAIGRERSSGGSNKGVLFASIAAAVLLAAGGAWYCLRPARTVERTPAPVAPVSNNPVNAAPASETTIQPASQPITRNQVVAPQPSAGSPVVPAASATSNKASANPQPVPVTRDNTRDSATTIPAAAIERISRPPAEPEPKKPALGEVHLESPTVTRASNAQNGDVDAPAISTGNLDANGAGLDSGLAAGNGKQPVAPEAPLAVGGDVKPARLIAQVSPSYPILAKNQHISGDVVVDALSDSTGHVTTMKVISGPSLLHQAAKDALRQWKYQPASLDGKAVAMHLTVTLQFRLQ